MLRFGSWVESQGEGELLRLAQAVRSHTVSGKSKYGDCELLADEFLCGAREAGLASPADSYIVWGWRSYDGSPDRPSGEHQWDVIRGVIYDLSADQFGPQEIVVTREGDPRYREKARMGHTFRRKVCPAGHRLEMIKSHKLCIFDNQ